MIAQLQDRELPDTPDGKRLPFQWKGISVGKAGIVFHWSQIVTGDHTRFLFTIGLDDREHKTLEFSLAESNEVLGSIDVPFAYFLQPFEFIFNEKYLPAINREGVRICLKKGTSPLWILLDNRLHGETTGLLSPHLTPSSSSIPNPWQKAFELITSTASLQPFGWLEGCVLEGLTYLYQLREWQDQAKSGIQQHLNWFFKERGIDTENIKSEPTKEWHGIEETLMAATLYRFNPNHPSINSVLQFWDQQLQKGHLMGGAGGYRKCEACYTVAYPMALIAQGRGDRDRLTLAIELLLSQKPYLFPGNTLYQGYYQGKGLFANWARGIAWYMLGFTGILNILKSEDHPLKSRLEEELTHVCNWILTMQNHEGLWYCYTDRPETGVETSGSAGIAGALAMAYRLHCTSEKGLNAAFRCQTALSSHLSHEGLLHGVSQVNKGGESLQADGYRCYSQMGTGLAVQLTALLAQHHQASESLISTHSSVCK